MQATTDKQDTAESWITRCPDCSTAFRITRQHLMAAKGSVRCGSCLHVFKAHQYIVGNQLPEDLQPAESGEPAAPTPASSSKSADTEAQDQAFTDDFSDDFEDELTSHSNKESPNEPSEDQTSTDKSSHKDLDLNNDAFSLDSDHSHFTALTGTEKQSDDDEAWAKAMLEEMDLEDTGSDPTIESKPESEPEHPPEHTEEFTAESDDWYSAKNDSENSRASFSDPKEPEITEIPEEENFDLPFTAQPFNELKDEPLSLQQQSPASRFKRVALPLVTVAFLCTLAGQFLFWNFTDLARSPDTRPVVSSICKVAGCTLPEQKDTSLIQARNIVVRNDAVYQNTLNVDAIITNTAKFTQPYPQLNMTVLDENQEPLASRILSPDEYLSGEAAGAVKMQPGQPVHLALKIISPSDNARNITLHFTP